MIRVILTRLLSGFQHNTEPLFCLLSNTYICYMDTGVAFGMGFLFGMLVCYVIVIFFLSRYK